MIKVAAALSDLAFKAMMTTRTSLGLFQKRRDVKASSFIVVQIQLSIKVDTLQLLLTAINRIDEGKVVLNGIVGPNARSIFFAELWRSLGISGTYQGKRFLCKILSNELVIVAVCSNSILLYPEAADLRKNQQQEHSQSPGHGKSTKPTKPNSSLSVARRSIVKFDGFLFIVATKIFTGHPRKPQV